MRAVIVGAVGAICLSGCSGSGGGTPVALVSPAQLAALSADSAAQGAMQARVDPLYNSAWSAIPTTGSYDYAGFAQITLPAQSGPFSEGLLLLGDLNLTANFAGDTIGGTITDVHGYPGLQPRGAAFAAVGHLDVGGDGGRSQIGDFMATPPGSLHPNSWTASYGGNLRIPDGDMRIDGVLTGQFQGTLISPTAGQSSAPALTGTGAHLGAVLNDEILPGTITVVAEN